MEPDIRYCTTADGVRIAYSVSGAGPVHVVMPEPSASHVQLEWSHPILGRLFERLAERSTVVRFDPRGSGLSDRVLPSTTEEWIRDLETVVTRLALGEFVLTGIQGACRATIAYAASHPEQVRKLVLINGFAHVEDVGTTAQGRALAALSSDWELATEAMGTTVFGSGRVEGLSHGAFIRACIDQDCFAQHFTTHLDIDSLMQQVTVPTLVLHHRASRIFTGEMSRELAAKIPDARLVELDGLWPDDIDGLAARIVAFVGDPEPATVSGSGQTPSGVRTVLFTDLVGHTEMMQRLGDTKGRDVLREHERITRETLKQHDGVEIKSDGDSFMVSFGSVAAAVDCAIALQRAFAARNEEGGEPLQLRMGLNAGEPVEEDGDLFGSTVILASRIAAKAGAGEILVPDTVRGLLSGKGFVFGDRGEFVPKGFDEGVRLWDVRWRED